MTDQPSAQRDPAALAAARSALPHVERWLAYRAWRLQVPGVQWAVWFDGAVQASGAIGVADLDTAAPLTIEHRFRIASHSKTFTATAVLALVEQGRMRLDAALSEHLPELADAPSGIGGVTVRELLEHGGGVLRDGLDSDYWQLGRPFPDEDELLSMVRDDGLKSGPGADFAYSNLGYSLLGAAIERVCGTPYRDAVRELVVDPLGLTRTTADLGPDEPVPSASGHSGLHTGRTRHRIPSPGTGAMAPATGFASTAEDVVRFLAALRVGSGELLGDGSKRLQQRRLRETGPDADRHYGLGLIVETVAGRRVIGHSGGFPGQITRSILDPEDGIAISVLTNAVDGPAAELASGALAILDAALERPARMKLDRRPARARRHDPVRGPLREPVGRPRRGAARRPAAGAVAHGTRSARRARRARTRRRLHPADRLGQRVRRGR